MCEYRFLLFRQLAVVLNLRQRLVSKLPVEFGAMKWSCDLRNALLTWFCFVSVARGDYPFGSVILEVTLFGWLWRYSLAVEHVPLLSALVSAVLSASIKPCMPRKLSLVSAPRRIILQAIKPEIGR